MIGLAVTALEVGDLLADLDGADLGPIDRRQRAAGAWRKARGTGSPPPMSLPSVGVAPAPELEGRLFRLAAGDRPPRLLRYLLASNPARDGALLDHASRASPVPSSLPALLAQLDEDRGPAGLAAKGSSGARPR